MEDFVLDQFICSLQAMPRLGKTILRRLIRTTIKVRDIYNQILSQFNYKDAIF